MKKVLYVFGGEKASGAEIVIQRLIDYNLANVEPHLFVSPGRFADELTALNKPYPIIKVSRLRKLNRSTSSSLNFFSTAIGNYLRVSIAVYTYIRKNDINIIHANTVVPASYLIPAIIFCRFFFPGKKWVWSDHDLQYFSKIDILCSKACVRLYDKTLVVSEAVKRKYRDRKSVFVLYNGLDLNLYKQNNQDRIAFRRQYNFPDESLILTIAATISPRKGQLQLIKVFKEILTKRSNINLVVAGVYGPDDEKYNVAVENAIKGDSSIFYLGHVTDMVKLYCGSDVIINNSNKQGGEPLGTTIYEAMACEKVVIAADTGGTSEIITDREDGFIFAAEDENDLKKALEFVVTNITSLNNIRENARGKVERKFSLYTMSETYNNYI
ncbi:MAG TPA: glycosyltransferase family 4 protein [Segetibacter sp.]